MKSTRFFAVIVGVITAAIAFAVPELALAATATADHLNHLAALGGDAGVPLSLASAALGAARSKELRDKQAQIVTDARERLSQITADTPEARAAELREQHDNAMKEFDRLQGIIDAEDALESRSRRLENVDTSRRPDRDSRGSERDQENRGGGEEEEGPTYRSAFAKFACGVDLSPEERQVLRQGQAEFRAQTAGTAAAGGYTVPTELAKFLSEAQKATGPMYDEDIVTVIPTNGGNPIKLPTIDDTASTAEAHTEGAALTDDGGKDVVFGQKSLDAYAFDTEFVRWSFELEQDGVFNMEQLLGRLLGGRLGRIANLQLTTGSGVAAPNGIVTASSLGKTAAATAAITADEIIDLLHSVDPAYRASPKARFMFNDQTLAAIRKLKDGDGNYLWQMGDVTKGVPGTLLGYRYSINQAMDNLAAAKRVIIFGDFGEYYVRKVGAPIIGVMRERFWPDLGIAGVIRFDGELGQSGAVKHLITAAA